MDFLYASVGTQFRDVARRKVVYRGNREGDQRCAQGSGCISLARCRSTPSNITQAVGSNVVQIADDLFNSGNIQVAGIPRLPCLYNPTRTSPKRTPCSNPISKRHSGRRAQRSSLPTRIAAVHLGTQELKSLDDIKGMKLRVAQPEQGEIVRRFGGTSITMSAPEVPSALDRGVVDGIFTAGVGAVLWKDLLKYGYVLIVNVNNSYFIANTEAYNKLSPDLQAKLRDVAQQSARWDRTQCRRRKQDRIRFCPAWDTRSPRPSRKKSRARSTP